jgi:hypothetical protein
MNITLIGRRRRAIGLVALTGTLLALVLAVMLGSAGQSAQAKTRSHVHHAIRHSHARTAATRTDGSRTDAQSESDGPGGANVQSGVQSAPDNQTGTDTEGTNSGGESSSAESDGPGGADTGGNCTGDCVQ